jgi:hypothetical protein
MRARTFPRICHRLLILLTIGDVIFVTRAGEEHPIVTVRRLAGCVARSFGSTRYTWIADRYQLLVHVARIRLDPTQPCR